MWNFRFSVEKYLLLLLWILALDAYDFTVIQLSYLHMVSGLVKSSIEVRTSETQRRWRINEMSLLNLKYSTNRFPGDCSLFSWKFYIYLFALLVQSWQSENGTNYLLLFSLRRSVSAYKSIGKAIVVQIVSFCRMSSESVVVLRPD